MSRGYLTKGVEFRLRAFCCLLLLLPYTVLEKEVSQSGEVGMGAPPPPVLESQSRAGVFGGLERRLLSGWPATNGLWVTAEAWRRFVLPQPVWPLVQRVTLAELQQWRLEGG